MMKLMMMMIIKERVLFAQSANSYKPKTAAHKKNGPSIIYLSNGRGGVRKVRPVHGRIALNYYR